MKFELKIDIDNPFVIVIEAYKRWVCKRKGHKMKKFNPPPFAMLDQMIGGRRYPVKVCIRCGHGSFAKNKIKQHPSLAEQDRIIKDLEEEKKKLVN